jgi:hypothetical protein
VIVAVMVAVAEPVIVAVHVHGNATVGVIEKVQNCPGCGSLISFRNAEGFPSIPTSRGGGSKLGSPGIRLVYAGCGK